MDKEEFFNYKTPVVKVVNFTIHNSILLPGSVTGDVDDPFHGNDD